MAFWTAFEMRKITTRSNTVICPSSRFAHEPQADVDGQIYDHRPDNDLPTWNLKGKHACDFSPWTAKIQESKTSGTAKASPNSGPRAFSALRR